MLEPIKSKFGENCVASELLKYQIQCFQQNSLTFVIKCEPFGVTECKRSVKLF